jgi:cellulose synthase (UDP-forming)
MLNLPDWLVALAPSILLLGIGVAVAPMFPRTFAPARVAMAILAIFFSLRYLAWRASETLAPPGWTLDALVSWSFFCFEAGSIISGISAFIILCRYRSRSADADRYGKDMAIRRQRVAIFIATYNEEWPVLERTIAGAVACDHANKAIYVLDDGRREWLGQRCRDMGVTHVTRPDNSDGKAGNINHALALLRSRRNVPDYVAVLDADFVPHRDFLTRGLALFADRSVGLVQTPQHFFNPDPIQHNLGISRSYPDEQRFFFDYMQPSRDAWGIAVCCGTSSIVRWQALEAIGDFPTSSVTEDYLLTATLAMHGYATVYLNEALSEGLAPEGLSEYITQRARWCLGLMQIVHSEAGPFSRRRLRWRDRWSILDSAAYWLTTFPFKLACMVYPLLYWYFGAIVMHAQINDVISYFIPYYLGTMLFLNFVSVGMFVPVVNDISQLVGAWEISRAAVIGLLRPRGHAFKVTMKGGARGSVTVQWTIMRRFILLFLLTLGGLLVGLVSDYLFDARAGEGKTVILFWTLYNLLVLAGTVLVCVEQPRTASILRSRPERVMVRALDRQWSAWLEDINLEAVRLRGFSAPAGTSLEIVIAGLGSVTATATLTLGATVDADVFLTGEQRERLVEKLYTRSGAPGTTAVAVVALGAGLLRRVIAGTIH